MKKLLKLRVALVHDTLVEFGGAEKLLQNFLELFPGASVYTSYYDLGFVHKFFPNLNPQRLFSFWMGRTLINSHPSLFQCLSPVFWKQFRLDNYDLVISNSGYFLCNMVRVKRAVHLHYIEALPKNLVGFIPKPPLQKRINYGPWLAKLYKKTLQASDGVMVNSKFVKSVLAERFEVSASVIYPPIDLPDKPPKKTRPEYFLCISRLSPEKNIELAIKACNKLRLPLKIAGLAYDPGYGKFLKSLSGPTVDFLGFLHRKEFARLYQGAKALIFTSRYEDFGMSAAESIAHGTPVIAYRGGGLPEIVIPGKTGVLYASHSVGELVEVLANFSPDLFNANILYNHAHTFSKKGFHQDMRRYILKKYATD